MTRGLRHPAMAARVLALGVSSAAVLGIDAGLALNEQKPQQHVASPDAGAQVAPVRVIVVRRHRAAETSPALRRPAPAPRRVVVRRTTAARKTVTSSASHTTTRGS